MKRLLFVFFAVLASLSAQQFGNPCASAGAFPIPFPVQNDGTTGTSLYKLADLTTGGNAILSNHTNLAGAVGVVVAGAGTVGSACVGYIGTVPLFVDGSSTIGHCVVRSITTDGEGHDTGAACTTAIAAGEMVGIVQTASTGANSLSVVLLKGSFNTPPASTAGTVTNTGGALTAHQVILGNGGNDEKGLGALGTTGQVLTSGGASADPTWATVSGTGTVTSVATTSPITGGTFSTTGNIACATCVTSPASMTLNRLVFGGGLQGIASGDLTGDVTTAGGKATSIANNAVTSAKTAVVNTYRTCTIDNDTQSSTALVAGNFSGGCEVPFAATIVEVDVFGGTGVIGGTVTTTGTSSVNLQKFTPNGGATTTLLSGALATATGYACALTGTSGTCLNGTTSSGTITISSTALAAGDWVRVSAATPDTTQTWYRVAIVYAVN